MARAAALVLLAGLAMVLAGCMGGTMSGGCDISTDRYDCGFGGTGRIEWIDTWENTGSRAQVDGGFGGTGSITITIRDADGTAVFEESFSGSGATGFDETTRSGTPGAWSIVLDGEGSGGFGIEVTKA